MIVYKYRDVSPRSLDILSSQELYFATPETLNDPLDSQIDIPAIYSSLRQFMGTVRGDVGSKLGFLVHILNEHEYPSKSGKPQKLADAMLQFVRALGICSLSKTVNDPLLWSHYCAGHTGFCIGFEESAMKLDGVFIRDDVEYYSSPPHRQMFLDLASELGDLVHPWVEGFKSDDKATDSFYSLQISRMMRANLLVKSDMWRYEREFRLIRNEAGVAKFEPSAVREIVFGLKTSDAAKRSVLQTVTDPKWAHVRIRRVYQESTSFDFTVLRESFCDPAEYLRSLSPEL